MNFLGKILPCWMRTEEKQWREICWGKNGLKKVFH